MAAKAAKEKNREDPPGILTGQNKRRILYEYYTDHGTRLFVENGLLVEETTTTTSYSYAPMLPYPRVVRPAIANGLLAEEKTNTCPPSYAPMLPCPSIESFGFSTSGPKVKPPSAADKAAGLAQSHRIAKAALEYLNSKRSVKFSLVEALRSGGRLWHCGIWYHCNFTAKREGDEDSTARLFFAEMKLVRTKCDKKYLVTLCCPVDDDSKTSRECDFCEEPFLVHPIGVSYQGLSQVKRSLRPRRNGKQIKIMAKKAAKVTNREDPPGFLMGQNERRVLDEYYTGRGTKLFVENGLLVEEHTDTCYTCPPSYSPALPFYAPVCPSYSPGPTIDSQGFSTSAPKVKPPSASDKAAGLEQSRETAEAALEYYNSKRSAKFSLVEPLRSGGELWRCGIWYHCNFTAKREGDEDSAARIFFAEMKLIRPKCDKEYLVTVCCPVDDDTKTTRKCDLCAKPLIVHPIGVSYQGLSQVKRSLRPRKNGKAISVTM